MPSTDLQALRTLSAAVLSDTLDSLGLMQQAMRPFMRPLDDVLQLIGRARTGLYMPVFEHRAGENPYAVEIALVDDLRPLDVVVLACNGPTDRIAPWGELLSTASLARGAAGCVTDGLVRDVAQIRAMRFPVFCGGIGPLDTKGRARMVERDVPVQCPASRCGRATSCSATSTASSWSRASARPTCCNARGRRWLARMRRATRCGKARGSPTCSRAWASSDCARQWLPCLAAAAVVTPR